MTIVACSLPRRTLARAFAGLFTFFALAASAQADTAPGGFIETNTEAAVRPLLSATTIQSLLPTRGKFTFPSPYGTTGIRLTNATDCGGAADCVYPVGYSYWRNINNHVGSDEMLIFIGSAISVREKFPATT